MTSNESMIKYRKNNGYKYGSTTEINSGKKRIKMIVFTSRTRATENLKKILFM
jgi:hypothetical protein